MAGRHRMPCHLVNNGGGPRGFNPNMHEGLPPIARGPLRPHLISIEEELEVQHQEIRRLVQENHYLGEDNHLLERELTAAKEEIHVLSQVVPKLRAEKEMQTRDLIQKGLKLEADLRKMEPLKGEVIQLHAEAGKLNASRQEMNARVQALSGDLARIQVENQQVPMLRAELNGLRQELVRARTAFEYEKAENVELMEQSQATEKNLVSMAHEVEKLQAEHDNVKKRPWAPGGGYRVMKGSPDRGFPGAYGDDGRYSREKGPPAYST
ncbi:hypothetical protein AMTR_s00173p00069210, partial [Amborella trichopoda]